jgi:hypothetical protein
MPPPWRHRLSSDPELFTYTKPRLHRIYFLCTKPYTDVGSYDVDFFEQALWWDMLSLTLRAYELLLLLLDRLDAILTDP